MIERTTFDLRIAEQQQTAARINAADWQHQGEPRRRAIRATVAAALVALAARLDSAPRPAETTKRPVTA